MKPRLTLFTIIAALFLLSATPAMAETGTVGDCLVGCMTGSNECSSCCDNTFKEADKSCTDSCRNAFIRCLGGCENNPNGSSACTDQCQTDFQTCTDTCSSTTHEFTCPDWIPPQKCPYDCQTWSPATRSCTGAPMNGCD